MQDLTYVFACDLLTQRRHTSRTIACQRDRINPLIATFKPQSNGPSYNNTVICTLAVDG